MKPAVRHRKDLRQYQRRAVRFMHRRKYGALLIDMGLGKTVIVLTAIVDLLRAGVIDSVLIIAPIRVMLGVWRQEAQAWSHTKPLKFSIIHGTQRERIEALQKPAHIHIINPEGVKWLASVMRKKPWPWQMLVVDESTEFSMPNTVRFRSLKKGLRHFKRRYVMTGTPTPRSLLQLWPQMFIADFGASLGQQFTDFRDNHFYRTGFKGKRFEPKEGSDETIAESMSARVVRLDAKDWLELPDVIPDPVWVDLPPDARELYDRFEAEMFLEFENFSADGDDEAVAETAGAKMMKCRQIANGFIFTSNVETGARGWRPLHDAKLDALREIAESRYWEPLLVPYLFKPDVPRILSAFPSFEAFDKRGNIERTIERWNSKKIDGLVLHPANSKYGLNLQFGGDALAWFGPTYSRLHWDQTNGRLARSGQRSGRVMAHVIMARNTVDEMVFDALQGYGNQQQRVNAAFRRYYNERLKRGEV